MIAEADKINKIWTNAWRQQKNVNSNSLFKNRLFIEGYPIFKSYIPHNVSKILEIGTGSGRYALKLAQDYPTAEVLATDIIDEAFSTINKMKNELHLQNFSLQVEDLFKLSLLDNQYDLIICDAVIQHLPNYSQSLKEMYRVLKPGGTLLLSVNNSLNFPHMILKFILGKKYEYGYEKAFRRKELKRLLENNGLKIFRLDGFYFAYGIFRLKKYFKLFKLLGQVINRLTSQIDRLSNRFISRYFGFEILAVAKKPNVN